MHSLIRAFYITLITSILLLCLYLPTQTFFIKNKKPHLNVFAWGGFIAQEVIEEFEKETDIKIKIHSYNSNEELFAKLKSGNPSDYDIIFPSDYTVALLEHEGLIKRLDKKRLDFLPRISPSLLGHPYDPLNLYSIPYTWEVCGIAFNEEVINKPNPSLETIFHPSGSYKTVMTPDPLEAVAFASLYLFGEKDHLTQKEAEEVRTLLKSQKLITEAYADYRAKYLIATNHSPAVLLKSSLITQLAKENPSIKFHLPHEGVFVSIENVCILSGSKNDDSAYAFINHLYKKEMMAINIDQTPLFPSCEDALPFTKTLEPHYFEAFEESTKRTDYYFFKYLLSEEETRELWIHTKR